MGKLKNSREIFLWLPYMTIMSHNSWQHFIFHDNNFQLSSLIHSFISVLDINKFINSATMLSCFAVCFSAVPFALELFNDVVLAPVRNIKLTYSDITFWRFQFNLGEGWSTLQNITLHWCHLWINGQINFFLYFNILKSHLINQS